MKSEKEREFTARALAALVNEMAIAKQSLRRIEVQIIALAKEHGINPVSP